MITLWSLSGTFFAVLFGGYLLYRGSLPEKLAAGTILLGWFSVPLLQSGTHLDIWTKGLDLLVFSILLMISISFRRVWILLVCAFQLATTVSHVVVTLANWTTPETIGAWAYITTIGLLGGKGIAFALGIGAFEARFWHRFERATPT